MIKADGLSVLEEKIESLNRDKNETYKFLGCEQGDKIDIKRVMQRVKTEVRKRTIQMVKRNLNDKNLIQTINSRAIPVAGYKMNVCHLGTGQLDCLDNTAKEELRNAQGHGKQASN